MKNGYALVIDFKTDEEFGIAWRAEGNAAEWHEVLQAVCAEAKKSLAPEWLARWNAACEAGRGPDEMPDANGWRWISGTGAWAEPGGANERP